MRCGILYTAAAAILLSGFSMAALAQRGTGESRGVAQRAEKPPLVTLTGTVEKVIREQCAHTRGRYKVGNHFILRVAEDETRNIHLGPAAVETVKKTADALRVTEPAKVTAFRTDRLKQDHYIAKAVTVQETTYTLRDDDLRPVWAGQRGRGGDGEGRRGDGRDRGRGRR